MEVLVDFFVKRRLLRVLKRRRKGEYVLVNFHNEGIVFRKYGRFFDKCFGVWLPPSDTKLLRSHLHNGAFLIFDGRVVSPLLKFILDKRRRWLKVTTF